MASIVTLSLGDCLEEMKKLPENSVDSVVTDPPYGFSFMGRAWDYEVPSSEIWAEALRVLKPGGHLLSFGGSRTYHRLVVEVEDAGFEIRDQLMWLYGSGFPKSMNIGKAIDKAAGAEREVVGRNPNSREKADRSPVYETGLIGKTAYITKPASEESERWEGWGTTLKPAHEPIVMARKPLPGSVVENVLEHGTGGLNIKASRIGTQPQGRFPSNVLLTHHPECVPTGRTLLASRGGDGAGGFGHHGKYGTGEIVPKDQRSKGWTEEIEEYECHQDCPIGMMPELESAGHWPDAKTSGFGKFGGGSTSYKKPGPKATTGSAARFFYCGKASRREREAGLPKAGKTNDRFDTRFCLECDANVPYAGACGCDSPVEWRQSYREVSNTHPTVKPISLMRYLVRLVTPPGGLVLDPFMGSGTTGIAAQAEGFDFHGMELEAEYLEISRKRIEWWDERDTETGEIASPPVADMEEWFE